MDSKNLGYGICGKRNVYKSNVFLDNWREDTIASELVQTPIDPTQHFQSVQMATHIPPSDMTYHPNILKIKLESVANLKERNKAGMPYSLLFAPSSEKMKDRFVTQGQLAQSLGGGMQKFSRVDGEKCIERQKLIKREMRNTFARQSEAREANRRLDPGSGEVRQSIGTTQDLPVFRRVALISNAEYH